MLILLFLFLFSMCVNSLFPEVICYQGDYIMHSFIAGLAFGIFLFYSVLNILYFYEIRNKSFTAKIRCDMDLYLLLFKVILEIAFSFLGENQNIILMGILSFGFMVFFLVNNNVFNWQYSWVFFVVHAYAGTWSQKGLEKENSDTGFDTWFLWECPSDEE